MTASQVNGTDDRSFYVRDCALAAVSTGQRAQNLRELSKTLASIPDASIYYHFWGSRLRPQFEHPEYHNDFAAWARHGLHDHRLAERLSIVDPTEFRTLEELRQELLDIIEERLDETEMIPWARREDQFFFIRSHVIVFSTPHIITQPEEFGRTLPALSVSSIFYHFIDARSRTDDATDDFRTWLKGFGDTYADLIQELSHVDLYFSSLAELRQRLTSVIQTYFRKRSVS
jgi:hypothetical protein